MFNNQNNYEVEFNRGIYTNNTFLIPNEFEHDVYIFDLNRRSNVGISVFPSGGELELELYRDRNNNDRLDRNDQLLDRSSGRSDQFLSNTVAQGTYFTHVGLNRLDRGARTLDYTIEINTNSNNNSGPSLLFPENSTNFNVVFRRGSYSNESFLIPDELEHDIYTFELTSRHNVDISVFPSGGRVELELYRDINNNGRLDIRDELLDRSNRRGDQFLNNRLAQGTYFTHVGLNRLDRGEDELVYNLEIQTNSNNNSRPPLLFPENTTNFDVVFRRGSYSNESFLIPDQFEHDLYKIDLERRDQIRISARPFNGRIALELYQDDNNNGRLDVEDDLIETSDNRNGREVLTDTVPRGTYFAHVGLSRIDRGEDQLDYSIEIETSSNSSRMSSLSVENITPYPLGSNNSKISLLPSEFTEDTYGLTTLSDSVDTPPA
jgi:hypothetical protein